jgi:FKBP-type peptidyl-prolyl cis-trans isomerase SlyD
MPTGRSIPEGFKEISKSDVPEEGQKVGAVLSTQGTKGEDVVLRVSEVKDNTVVLDFNHPLAGKTLDFEIKVLDIQPAADA